MSEEEKKAIEYLKKTVDFWKRNNIKDRYEETIRNLIEKLQKENEKLKNKKELEKNSIPKEKIRKKLKN